MANTVENAIERITRYLFLKESGLGLRRQRESFGGRFLVLRDLVD